MPVETRKTDRVDAYTKKYWQKDSANDNEVHRDGRLGDYAELVNGERATALRIDPKDITMVRRNCTSMAGVGHGRIPLLTSS